MTAPRKPAGEAGAQTEYGSGADDILTTQARLADLRIRVLNNQPIEPSEYRDLLMDLRRHRVTAAAASSKARRTATKTMSGGGKPTIDINDMFGGTYNE